MVATSHQLLQLAEEMVSAPGAGAPRQVVLRRAVSTAYYAAFHCICGNAAEVFVSANDWKSRVLFYRALEHGKAKDRCIRLGKNPLPQNEKNFFSFQSFGLGLRTFANSFVLLQELRHRCDYDPDYKISKAQTRQAVDDARQAIADLEGAAIGELRKFLAYLLFGLRPQ